MKINGKTRFLWLLVAMTSISSFPKHCTDLVVVVIIDQLSYHQLQAIKPYVRHGFKTLLDHGVVYERVRHPHAWPTTATGHAALSTGTTACDHGIPLNSWLNGDNTQQCYHDANPAAALFVGYGRGPYGVSAQNLMVNTLSDQMALASTDDARKIAYALSYKCRAAIGLAGRRGKPIWLDPSRLRFTSSGAFFDELPSCVHRFNALHTIPSIRNVLWQRVHDPASLAYRSDQAVGYAESRMPQGLVGTMIETQSQENSSDKRDGLPRSTLFTITPDANDLLLKLAQCCIDHAYTREGASQVLIWVSLSSLDRLGHLFGPYSHEALDMLYHLDVQIEQFMNKILKKYKKRKPVFVVTADHGVMPMRSHLKKQYGYDAPYIDTRVLAQNLNDHLAKAHGHEKLIRKISSNHIFFDQARFKDFDFDLQQALIDDVVRYVRRYPGIAQAWSVADLRSAVFPYGSHEYWAQQQIFPGRTGSVVMIPQQYVGLSKHQGGALHRSPYDYDVHVPLMIYAPGIMDHKIIHSPSLTTQLPVTLAQLLGIDPPQSSRFCRLPER